VRSFFPQTLKGIPWRKGVSPQYEHSPCSEKAKNELRFGSCVLRFFLILFPGENELPQDFPLHRRLSAPATRNSGGVLITSSASYPELLNTFPHLLEVDSLHGRRPVPQSSLQSTSLWRWLDVLVYAEEVCRVILLLDGGKSSVIVAERCLNSLQSFVHHEVDVRSARRVIS